MSPFTRDLRRLVDGASLVAFQAFKQSATAFKPAESDSFLSNALKSALVYATDVAGITRGKIHRHSPADVPPSSAHKNRDSVIYFSDPPPETPTPPSPTPESIDRENLSNAQALVSVSAPQVHASPNNDAIDPISIYKNSNGSVALVNDQTRPSQSVLVEAESPTDHNASLLLGPNEKPDIGSGRASALKRRRPRERKVPSTPLGRALGFAGLGAGLAWGTVQESARRLVYGTPNSSDKQSALSPFLSEKNAERLALALCRMRGAALKLGQMLSIQDESLIPAPILSALDIVRQGADVMPRSQLNDVLDSELGFDWTKKLKSFDYEPLASASIGQVHRAVLKDGLEVAMKIQYPGVADSIDSDIDNARRLLDYTNLIPKGLFLDRAIKVAKEELSRECDYELEASNQKRFRELLSNTEGVYVPMVIDEISSKRVLTTELVTGIPIDKVSDLNQETRNYVGKKLLELALKELFVFRFMQTDPNWSNFLYDEATNMINLIDFGAAREYRKGFVDDYLRMVLACANRDRAAIIEMSTRLGFLTGMEPDVMLNAHVQASFIVGLPFSSSGTYDFRSSNITSSISHLGATMLKHRLTPPPDEAYSLHRKLSGAFLACIKLGVAVPCRDLLLQVYQQYRFSDENEETLSNSLA